MIAAVVVAISMAMYFVSLRGRQGGAAGFDWTKFWVALGVLAALAALGPLCLRSKFLTGHPLVATGLMFLTILGAVLWLTMWGLKRKQARQGVL